MHCDCCYKLLSEYETSFKGKISGEFLNTCSKCLEGLGIAYTGNVLFTDKEVNEEVSDLDIDIFITADFPYIIYYDLDD